MKDSVDRGRKRMLLDFLLGGGLLAITIVIPVFFQGGSPIEIFRNQIGYTPSGHMLTTAAVAASVAWLSISLLLITLNEAKSEYADFVDAEEKRAEPTPPPPEATTLSPREHLIAYYEGQQYNRVGVITISTEVTEKIQAELYAQEPELNTTNVWHRRAVLIYEDASMSSFQIAVLYSDESWQKSDTEHVQQKRRGRPVHIRNALDRPFMRTMLNRSDYALCFGLASSEISNPPDRNSLYADDRAWHCGSAIVGLGFQSSSRVRAFGLGYALTEADDPEILARQRSVVVVGVDTSSNPAVNDVVQAIGKLVTLTGVDLSKYSRSGANSTQFFRIPPDSYNGTAELKSSDEHDPDTEILVPLSVKGSE